MGLKKRVKISVYKDGEPILITDELRIDFRVENLIGDALNVGTFEIYNLNKPTVDALSEGTLSRVVLEVGAATDKVLNTLFDGNLINMHHTPMFETAITTLWCWEKGINEGRQYSEGIPPYEGRTIRDIVTDIADKILDENGNNLYTLDFSAATRADLVVPVFYVVDSFFTCIERVLRDGSMLMTKRDGVIYVSDRLTSEDYINTVVAKLKEAGKEPLGLLPILLKKPVEFGLAEVNVTYNLTPNIKPLDVISVLDGGLQSSVKGFDEKALQIVENVTRILPREFYFLLKVVHSGSVYTNDWSTEMHGIIYKNSLGG